MTVRRTLLRLHRWVALAAAAFWLVQAASGVAIVFHWELEDATFPGAHRATDLDALQARLAVLAPVGSQRRVVSLWTTAGRPDRYKINLEGPGTARTVVRVAGDGTVLDQRDKRASTPMDTLVSLHQTLLAGDAGRWIVESSGVLLIVSLGLGVANAWPRYGGWRLALTPRGAPSVTAQLFGWHRALGLWLALPAIVLASAGILLVFEDNLRDLLGDQPAEIARLPPTGPPVPFLTAARAALATVPHSRLTMVAWPTASDATYRVRLLAPGELRRAYGLTTVFVDANSGRVRQVVPANSGPIGRRFADLLYAVHTGEAEGLAGRLLNLTIGLWLIAMIGLGIALWTRRRRLVDKRVPAARPQEV
ncbi:PepSY-associated TM helix domain-containing protein [Phenylobacterium sp.]|jgi:uncharacterized iron-regulated membrane protein|uniref:PepSY-associated TM helix domain-containing protein n=1 Tax=Phenylobacterium sp. TaxID=1871053 RepID=UPI002E35F565|nr:PepSY-associated TM helix domain-containing protein [Phenylobacterium sp.]HEX3367458.1 PepSY-associated TM helix domain-containing protein [Phenylobacterium sp.]